jgi:hypothetical protein
MPAEKQQQFRADIKANSKPWESEIEFTMPGELKLYRDYELTDESEVASAAGKKGGKKGGATDANPETKKANSYALNPKNKDGLDSKWQHGGNKQVGDGTGKGTMVRACVKGANKLVDDGSGNGTMVRPCNMARRARGSDKCKKIVKKICITCNVAQRARGSDKCNPCDLAVMVAFLRT